MHTPSYQMAFVRTPQVAQGFHKLILGQLHRLIFDPRTQSGALIWSYCQICISNGLKGLFGKNLDLAAKKANKSTLAAKATLSTHKTPNTSAMTAKDDGSHAF
jgi:hypothetical protein